MSEMEIFKKKETLKGEELETLYRKARVPVDPEEGLDLSRLNGGDIPPQHQFVEVPVHCAEADVRHLLPRLRVHFIGRQIELVAIDYIHYSLELLRPTGGLGFHNSNYYQQRLT